MTVSTTFWSGKRVLLTGHTGFKGSWLSLWLQNMGCDLYGLAKAPHTNPSMFNLLSLEKDMCSIEGDITDSVMVERVVKDAQPEIVIHMAAQPLVRESYANPRETYLTNVIGTANILDALRLSSRTKVFLNVTTDKCYENQEWVWGYREEDRLGGHDPYSSSKACSELITSSYRRSFFYEQNSLAVASARAGNVIGGGDWSTDRLIPDVLSAFRCGELLRIRNPNATRPWQHVLEPLSGYLRLVEKLYSGDTLYRDSWNFGPNDDGIRPVSHLVNYMASKWHGKCEWDFDLDNNVHEANLLKLDISKAKNLLQWEPKLSLESSLDWILEWEKCFQMSADLKIVSLGQIERFMELSEMQR